ncbi:hypothetical protein KSP39_PZI003065 [Platanthera zijinensis]|uniref:Uncharacterized protein n=1 Tax=Platanthera zijinensis TaxID=2320716 RepID=A0AAP0BXB7_9ASPA
MHGRSPCAGGRSPPDAAEGRPRASSTGVARFPPRRRLFVAPLPSSPQLQFFSAARCRLSGQLLCSQGPRDLLSPTFAIQLSSSKKRFRFHIGIAGDMDSVGDSTSPIMQSHKKIIEKTPGDVDLVVNEVKNKASTDTIATSSNMKDGNEDLLPRVILQVAVPIQPSLILPTAFGTRYRGIAESVETQYSLDIL